MFTMINPPIDRLMEKVDNKYMLAQVVAKRAREIYEGDEKLIEEDHMNLITVAVEELDQDKVGYYLVEEDEKPAKIKTDVDLNDMLNSSL